MLIRKCQGSAVSWKAPSSFASVAFWSAGAGFGSIASQDLLVVSDRNSGQIDLDGDSGPPRREAMAQL